MHNFIIHLCLLENVLLCSQSGGSITCELGVTGNSLPKVFSIPLIILHCRQIIFFQHKWNHNMPEYENNFNPSPASPTTPYRPGPIHFSPELPRLTVLWHTCSVHSSPGCLPSPWSLTTHLCLRIYSLTLTLNQDAPFWLPPIHITARCLYSWDHNLQSGICIYFLSDSLCY